MLYLSIFLYLLVGVLFAVGCNQIFYDVEDMTDDIGVLVTCILAWPFVLAMMVLIGTYVALNFVCDRIRDLLGG